MNKTLVILIKMRKLFTLAAVGLLMAACGSKQENTQTNINPQTTEAMDFLEMTKQRYSERFFDTTKPVEQAKLDRILEAGRLAPTAANKQPQRFYLLRSPEILKKTEEACFSSLYGAPVAVLVCYDLDSTWHNSHETLLPDYNSGEQDCAIAATQMMYAAEEQGVHTIWIRGFNARAIQQVLGLPEKMIPAMILPLGYPSDKSAPAPMHYKRKTMDEFLTEL